MNDTQNFRIIGIDCAADPKNIAVAIGSTVGTRLTVERVLFGASGTADEESRRPRLKHLAAKIVEKIPSVAQPTLLALDAPLGWPKPMGGLLEHHTAGTSLPEENENADLFFRRRTDQFIAGKTGKTPIEVGANLIARVTHTTLRLIGMLQSELKNAAVKMADAPLRSYPAPTEGVNFIEVYPALAGPFFLGKGEKTERRDWRTLAAELKTMKKKAEDGDAGTWDDRLSQVEKRLGIRILQDAVNDTKTTKARRDHGLDAILCAWTGFRFLRGGCVTPDEAKASHKVTADEVKQEGWIWFDRRVLRTGSAKHR